MKAPPPSTAAEAPAPPARTQPWAIGLIVMGCLVALGTGLFFDIGPLHKGNMLLCSLARSLRIVE